MIRPELVFHRAYEGQFIGDLPELVFHRAYERQFTGDLPRISLSSSQ
ncbi:hypothetical protein [Neobacillus mesonae]|nr:hypothetical protein [Neobacillus mesonae]MCM3570953.1 hypothetical protein [Neobacillus mesonae]